MVVTVPNDSTAYTEGIAFLPDLTDLGRESHVITIGNGGDTPVEYTLTADRDWIMMKVEGVDDKATTGILKGSTIEDSRILISADWEQLKTLDEDEGTIIVEGSGRCVTVKVKAVRYDITGLPPMTFIDTHGVVSIEAEHYAQNVPLGGGEWKVIDDYGRTLSSMKVFPTTLDAKKPGVDAPYLEYRFTSKSEDEVTVYIYLAPTNNLTVDTGMKYGVSVDSGKPKIVDTFKKTTPVGYGKVWEEGVMQNCRISKTKHKLDKQKVHTLRIYMVDAGFVLQKIVIDSGNNLLESFLGPEESYYIKQINRNRLI